MVAAPEITDRAGVCAVGIDWGTTHRRGVALAADGACVAMHEDADGLLAARGRFAPSLATMMTALGATDPTVELLMSGMVGSAQGWHAAPYLDPSVPLRELRRHLVTLPDAACAGRRARIVPGYCQRRAESIDVMRGEETQLLGAVMLGHDDGWFVLPGTHSKWVRLRAGAIDDMATFMTGELFDLLGRHGTLAAAAAGEARSEAAAEAFACGLTAEPEAALSHRLFGARARVVSGDMPAEALRPYLSGVLVGAEWHDLQRRGGGRLPPRVTLIGSPMLAAQHAAAAAAFDVELRTLDPQAVHRAALSHLLG